MSKKLIIISVVSILVISGGVVGALLLTKGQPKPSTTDTVAFDNQPKTKVETKADLSKDYGACELVKKDFIKSTLGKSADSLQGPDNVGRAYVGNGDESQTCVYSFAAGGTIDNSFGADNGFSVTVYAFKDQTTLDTLQAVENTHAVAVSNLGDSATFTTYADFNPGQTQYILTVYSGLKYYAYTLTQPTKSATFTQASAKTALLDIANSVTYKND